jgi:hypothetical protein
VAKAQKSKAHRSNSSGALRREEAMALKSERREEHLRISQHIFVLKLDFCCYFGYA